MEIRSFNFKRQYFNVSGIIRSLLFVAGVLVISSRLVFGFAPEEKQPPNYQIRTLKFFIYQNPNTMAGGSSSGIIPFNIFIGEKDPVIKDAYIELTGVTSGPSDITIDTRAIQEADSFATVRAKTFSLGSFVKSNHFKFLYAGNAGLDDSSLLYYLQRIIQAPGSYSFEFKADIAVASVSALRARMVITYQFTPPTSGALPVSGYVISSTFDTGQIQGAAYNSLMWKGNTNGGKVRLQLATSTIETGPWNDVDFKGDNCDSNSYYEPADDTPIEINPLCAGIHNNKQFFRYKIILCSLDCEGAGDFNPEVTGVVVNWAK